jgi:CRAL/TRIO domain
VVDQWLRLPRQCPVLCDQCSTLILYIASQVHGRLQGPGACPTQHGLRWCRSSHSLRADTAAACRHVIGEFSEADSQALCAYFVEQAVAARPQGVDTVIGIFDLADFGLGNADFSFVRFLIQCFFFYYPKRAGEVLMVDAPWAFMPPFSVMKPLLGKYAELIKFVSRREAAAYFRPGEAPPGLL